MDHLKVEDPRLGLLLKKGLEGDFVISGYPYDIGDKRANQKVGADYGPDNLFKRFLPKIGPVFNAEYNINIDKLNVSLFGNILLDDKVENIDKILSEVELHNYNILKFQKIPILIGGSKDQFYGCQSALFKLQQENNKKIGTIKISNILECEEIYNNEITRKNAIRKLLQDNQSFNNFKLQYFGVHDNQITKAETDFLAKYNNNISVITFSEIKKQKISDIIYQSLDEPTTAAAKYYKKIQDEICSQVDLIHLSLSLEALNAANCPGVSNPCLTQGFTNEEMIEIMMLAGKSNKVVSLDICDYNSGQEDFITGRLLANFIYYFLLGKASKQIQ